VQNSNAISLNSRSARDQYVARYKNIIVKYAKIRGARCVFAKTSRR